MAQGPIHQEYPHPQEEGSERYTAWYRDVYRQAEGDGRVRIMWASITSTPRERAYLLVVAEGDFSRYSPGLGTVDLAHSQSPVRSHPDQNRIRRPITWRAGLGTPCAHCNRISYGWGYMCSNCNKFWCSARCKREGVADFHDCVPTPGDNRIRRAGFCARLTAGVRVPFACPHRRSVPAETVGALRIQASVWWMGVGNQAMITFKEIPSRIKPAVQETRDPFPMIVFEGERAKWVDAIAAQPRGPAQQEALLASMRGAGYHQVSDAVRFQLQMWPLRPEQGDFQWLHNDHRAILQRRQSVGRERAHQPRGWPSPNDHVVTLQNLAEMLLPKDETSLKVRTQWEGVTNQLGVEPKVVADIVAMRQDHAPTRMDQSRHGTHDIRVRCDNPTVQLWVDYGEAAMSCHNCGDRICDQSGLRCTGCPAIWCSQWCSGRAGVKNHACSGIYYLRPRKRQVSSPVDLQQGDCGPKSLFDAPKGYLRSLFRSFCYRRTDPPAAGQRSGSGQHSGPQGTSSVLASHDLPITLSQAGIHHFPRSPSSPSPGARTDVGDTPDESQPTDEPSSPSSAIRVGSPHGPQGPEDGTNSDGEDAPSTDSGMEIGGVEPDPDGSPATPCGRGGGLGAEPTSGCCVVPVAEPRNQTGTVGDLGEDNRDLPFRVTDIPTPTELQRHSRLLMSLLTESEPGSSEAGNSGMYGGRLSSPPVTLSVYVSGSWNRISSLALSGTYSRVGSHQNHSVFRRRVDNRPGEAFLYYWDPKDGRLPAGWWFGPAVGGGLVWAYNDFAHPSGLPPPYGWATLFERRDTHSVDIWCDGGLHVDSTAYNGHVQGAYMVETITDDAIPDAGADLDRRMEPQATTQPQGIPREDPSYGGRDVLVRGDQPLQGRTSGDSARSHPVLVVSNVNSRANRAAFNGEYHHIGTYQDHKLFERISDGGTNTAYLYHWKQQNGHLPTGWWFGPAIGGDSVWAFHPATNGDALPYGLPPASGWVTLTENQTGIPIRAIFWGSDSVAYARAGQDDDLYVDSSAFYFGSRSRPLLGGSSSYQASVRSGSYDHDGHPGGGEHPSVAQEAGGVVAIPTPLFAYLQTSSLSTTPGCVSRAHRDSSAPIEDRQDRTNGDLLVSAQIVLAPPSNAIPVVNSGNFIGGGQDQYTGGTSCNPYSDVELSRAASGQPGPFHMGNEGGDSPKVTTAGPSTASELTVQVSRNQTHGSGLDQLHTDVGCCTDGGAVSQTLPNSEASVIINEPGPSTYFSSSPPRVDGISRVDDFAQFGESVFRQASPDPVTHRFGSDTDLSGTGDGDEMAQASTCAIPAITSEYLTAVESRRAKNLFLSSTTLSRDLGSDFSGMGD